MEGLGGKAGETVLGLKFLSEMRAFKSTHVYTEKFRKPCTCAGEDTCSEKTLKDPKLPPLAILNPQGEQEVKAKSPSPSTEANLQKLEMFYFPSFFFFSFFSSGPSRKSLSKH